MKLRDSNGQIMIDDKAAEDDINKLNKAILALDDVRLALYSVKEKAEVSWAGAAQEAFKSKDDELTKAIKDTIEKIVRTKKAIGDTVEHYKEIDRKLKATVESGLNNLSQKGGKK